MSVPESAASVLHARVLNGSGGARHLAPAGVGGWTPAEGILWLHIDFSQPGAYELLEAGLPVSLPEVVLDVLTNNETRPRAVTVEDGLLVALRGVNMNPGQNPADMVSIRVWVAPELVITSRRRRLLAVQDILGDLEKGDGPASPGDILVHLVERLADRIGTYVDRIEDQLLTSEDAMAEKDAEPQRLGLAKTRRQIANVRRFVAPQRDALEKAYRYPPAWFPPPAVQQLREEADRIARYVEDLDLARERAILLHEEYQGMIAQQQNSRMYVLSIVAAIFLPLTFVTGLLGMNVGGLPGLDNDLGFTWSIFVMIVCAIFAGLVFRWKKWM